MPALSNNYQLFLVYAIHEMYSMSHNSLFPTFHNQKSLIRALFKPSINTMPNQPTAKHTSSYHIVCSQFFSLDLSTVLRRSPGCPSTIHNSVCLHTTLRTNSSAAAVCVLCTGKVSICLPCQMKNHLFIIYAIHELQHVS